MAKYKTSIDDFETWCVNRVVSADITSYSTKGEFKRISITDVQDPDAETREYIRQLGEQNEPANVKIMPFGNNESLDLSFSHSPKSSKISNDTIPNYWDLEVTGNNPLRLSGAIVRNLTLTGSVYEMIFKNCFIDTLHVANGPNNLTLTDCFMGTLRLGHRVLNNFTVNGGTIRAVECPAPDAENPFTGSVTFPDVDFPTRRSNSKLFKGPQQYRNLRAQLRKLENVPETSHMRALELASQRESDTGTFKFVSWLYWQISDYGRSPAKPLRMLLYVYLTMVIAVFLGNAGVLGLENSAYVGWRTGFDGQDLGAQWSRAFFLPGQSIFNPGGIFGTKILVIAKNGWWQMAMVIQGLVCDIFIAMFAFAIRKHFKVQ